MRLLHGIVAIALAACTPAVEIMPSPSEVPTSPTPYAYPDLPGGIEDTIAEADCEDLDTVAAFMDRDSVDPVVRHQAMDAIAHRSEELGC
jgi:hypothetical protein